MKKRKFVKQLFTIMLSIIMAIPVTLFSDLGSVVAYATEEYTDIGGIFYTITDTTNHTVEVSGHSGDITGSVVIPESITIGGVSYTVTRIGDNAFYECMNMKGIELPDGIISIGEYAFYRCASMEFSNIPSELESVGLFSFYDCNAIEEIVFPEGFKTIGGCAFASCRNLNKVSLPNSLTTLSFSAFSECKNLTSIKIPESITVLESNVLSDCDKLTDVELPSTMTKIEHDAFSNCNSLEKIKLPDGVTEIGSYAFYCCRKLSGIDIPEGVTVIESKTFDNCWSLKYVNLPSGLTSIGDGAFAACDELTSVVIPDGVTSIGKEAFYLSDKLTFVKLSSSLESIGDEAFYWCPSLTTIAMPDKTVKIGVNVFKSCNSFANCYTFSTTINLPVMDSLSYTYFNYYKIALDGGKFANDWLTSNLLEKEGYAFIGWIAENGTFTKKLPETGGRYTAQYVAAGSLPNVNISVPADSNMTKEYASGREEQKDVYEEMVPVVYTADEGYYFPENYNSDNALDSNGITVTRDSYTQITVSGTPKENTIINLLPATKKASQAAPKVTAGVCEISGTTTNMEYATSLTATYWNTCSEGATAVTKGTYYVRYKGTDKLAIGETTMVEIKYPTVRVDMNLNSHFNKTNDSDSVFQTNIQGDMQDVVFVTDEGYYFPEDYVSRNGLNTKGIVVTRDSAYQITVSGRPTDDCTITLPNASAQGYNVTFDANGGKIGTALTENKTVKYKEAIGILSIPERTGYSFAGWYTEATSGYQISKDTVLNTTDDVTYYAHWNSNDYRITLDANGGMIGSFSTSSKIVFYGREMGELSTPTRTGYTFAGWYTEKTGGTKITSNTITDITANKTYYAHWTANKYTVTLDANGGKVGTTTTAKKTVSYGGKFGTLSTPTKTGYTFAGWYTAKIGGTKITSTSNVNITSNRTYYAHWTANRYTVSLYANGGKIGNTTTVKKTVTYATRYGTLSTPIRTGYTFAGWYTAKTGGTKITSTSNVYINSTRTYYAHWTAKKYTISLNANGGKVGKSTIVKKTVTYNQKIGTLSTPSRSRYKFLGWYTARTGGTKITSSSIVKITAGRTYYAHWKKK